MTNVCDVNLGAATTAAHAAAEAASETTTSATIETTTATTRRTAGEARLRLTVLCSDSLSATVPRQEKIFGQSARAKGLSTYFAHIDKSAHEVLVRECVYSVLSLVSCCIFHNSSFVLAGGSRSVMVRLRKHTRIPNITRTEVLPSIHCPTHKKARETSDNHKPTFDIPFGRSNTSANSTSPAAGCQQTVPNQMRVDMKWMLTAAHKIFEMMPLDVV